MPMMAPFHHPHHPPPNEPTDMTLTPLTTGGHHPPPPPPAHHPPPTGGAPTLQSPPLGSTNGPVLPGHPLPHHHHPHLHPHGGGPGGPPGTDLLATLRPDGAPDSEESGNTHIHSMDHMDHHPPHNTLDHHHHHLHHNTNHDGGDSVGDTSSTHGGCSGGMEPPGMCAGCGGKIIDRYFLMAVDKQWHVTCLTCTECNRQLDSALTCFAKDGRIYCKEDYYRRFAVKKCARCESNINANEMVMRARDHVYHIHCFTCVSCNSLLNTGEHFGMKDSLIYCKIHYEVILQQEDALSHHTPPPTGNGVLHTNGVLPHGMQYLPNGAHPPPVQKGRPKKRRSPMRENDLCVPMGMCPSDGDLGGMVGDMYPGGHNVPRQKRVRTSFKHHQLRTMKSYFNLNHNPDAKDLKQLAQKTGLSKRVLQVWFQNARAKYRRGALKDPSNRDLAAATNNNTEDVDLHSLTELPNSGSPAMSDISSDMSLSDHLHQNQQQTGGPPGGPQGQHGGPGGQQQGSNTSSSHLSDSSEHSQSAGSTLTELFTNSINTTL